MKVGWALTALIWALPVCSMLACPFDLHGSSTCTSVGQLGRAVSYYLVAPGLWAGAAVSNHLPRDPHTGVSAPALILGITCWLTLLSAITLYVGKAVFRRRAVG